LVTKWKNRIILIILLLLFTQGLSGILTSLSNSHLYLHNNYFETNEFQYQYNVFLDYLSMFELNYISPKEMKSKIIVTEEDIKEHRYHFGNLADQVTDIKTQYEQKIQSALATENNDLANIYIAERDMKIEDITSNFKSDEYVKAKIIKEKEQEIDEYYKELERYRANFVALKGQFSYYLQDILTGEIYTNLKVDNDKKVDELINTRNTRFIQTYPSSSGDYITSKGSYGNSSIVREYLGNNNKNFSGKIGILNSASSTGPILAKYFNYQREKVDFIIYMIISIILLLGSIFIYKKTKIVKIQDIDKWQACYNRLPIDADIVIFMIIGFMTLQGLRYSISPYYQYSSIYNFFKLNSVVLFIVSFFLFITVIQGRLLFNRIKESSDLRKEWKKTLIYNAVQRTKEAFLNRSVGFRVLLLLFVIFCSGFGVVPVLIDLEMIIIYLPLFILITMPTLIILIKQVGRYNKIVNYSNDLANGYMGEDLTIKGRSTLATLASNLNKLKSGVKASQKEQFKSERLKTELITNVSHDLRTPLTSIITYTDLLKSQDLTDDEKTSYIEILDRKSKRLKILIDDLFEASKMASGNIELTKERVDIIQLLHQTLAEHDEIISESSLEFKVVTPDKPIYVFVDGQKIWRVFDNLIGNILKYSLENTRVYISIKVLNDYVNIEFKNISKYELNINAEELSERFKRGDTSRNTDGSGLGLAIAKSIVDLHDGNLDIDIDGDLFKVTVKLNPSNN